MKQAYREMDEILQESNRLQKRLQSLEIQFNHFEKELNKLNNQEEPNTKMLQEYIELKKEHLKTKWIYLKISYRRKKLKEKYKI